jgi:hypothetical protein
MKKISIHMKMVEKWLSGAHVFIFTFHLHGNRFSKIMSILLESTHIKDLINPWHLLNIVMSYYVLIFCSFCCRKVCMFPGIFTILCRTVTISLPWVYFLVSSRTHIPSWEKTSRIVKICWKTPASFVVRFYLTNSRNFYHHLLLS